MPVSAQQALDDYTDAYHRLYRRTPPDIQTLDRDWAAVNGVRMHVDELTRLTAHIRGEYAVVANERRQAIRRIVSWLEE